jgi:hypothetical protein
VVWLNEERGVWEVLRGVVVWVGCQCYISAWRGTDVPEVWSVVVVEVRVPLDGESLQTVLQSLSMRSSVLPALLERLCMSVCIWTKFPCMVLMLSVVGRS